VKLPEFELPALIARVGARLPQLPPTLALVSALNLGLGRIVSRETLEPLAGRAFAIRVLDAGLTLRFKYDGRRFQPLFGTAAVALTVSARLRDFIALLTREEDPDALFFNRRLLMEGDTELGLLVKNTVDGIDFSQLVPERLKSPLRPLRQA
jgi:predicted lipid carrier protein YhbT